jgi:hypothetical protein
MEVRHMCGRTDWSEIDWEALERELEEQRNAERIEVTEEFEELVKVPVEVAE